MNDKELISRSRIDPARLSGDRYAESLAAEALRTGLMDEGDLDRIRGDLMKVLAEVIGYKTEGKSTNVSTETAKSLAESIFYNIGTALRQEKNPDAAALSMKNTPMSDLYAKGYLVNKKRWEEARVLWGKVRYTERKDGGEAYERAIGKNIRIYLEQYDPRTSAHDRLFLVLPELGIKGAFHIGGTVSVLKKLLKFNEEARNPEGAVSAEFREGSEERSSSAPS